MADVLDKLFEFLSVGLVYEVTPQVVPLKLVKYAIEYVVWIL